MSDQTKWEIRPRRGWFELDLRELIRYKDLLFRLVRRDFLMLYQQTLLGPVWIILQPLLTVITYVLIFHKTLRIPTNDVPPFLFYLTGITLWNLFSDVFTGTAATFTNYVHVFSKVYFPRLIVPFSATLLHLSRLGVQLLLLLAVLLFYHLTGRYPMQTTKWLYFIFPIVVAAGMGLAGGLIFSVLTAKYRDLTNVLHLFVRILMFVCPIFFSTSFIPEDTRWIINLNPLAPMFELFRYAWLGSGNFTTMQCLYSFGAMAVLLFTGIILFNKKADTLLDVV